MENKFAKKEKKLFDLADKIGEGVHGKLHIIDVSENLHSLPDEKVEYRVYHSDGYCFDISREPIELAEDESCDSCIDGFQYSFMDGIYEGFKELTIDEAIKILSKA